MGKPVIWPVLLVLAGTAGLAGCVRPVGDLGRVRASATHDSFLPAVGEGRAALAGEPVSRFNQTDTEREMHDRLWRFLVSPRNQDWSFDFASEMKRTRIGPDAGMTFGVSRYHRWLHGTGFASSPVRYARVAEDLDADLAMVPDAFHSVCAVGEVDRQRGIAFASVGRGDATLERDLEARRAENAATIGWFSKALRYRVGSYAYALDHLLIETPDEGARAVDRRLRALEGWAARAERHDFCGGADQNRKRGETNVRSRVLMSSDVDLSVPK